MGKTTLARRLGELLPDALVVKLGEHARAAGKNPLFFDRDARFSSVLEAIGDAAFAVIESGAILDDPDCEPDLVIFLPSPAGDKPGATRRRARADQAQQSARAAEAGRQAHHHLGLAEAGLPLGDPQVAGPAQFGAAAGTIPRDRRDADEFFVADGRDRVEPPHRVAARFFARLTRLTRFIRLTRHEPVQVGQPGVFVPVPLDTRCQYTDPASRFTRRFDRARQLRGPIERDAIVNFGMGQGHERHAFARMFEGDELRLWL